MGNVLAVQTQGPKFDPSIHVNKLGMVMHIHEKVETEISWDSLAGYS